MICQRASMARTSRAWTFIAAAVIPLVGPAARAEDELDDLSGAFSALLDDGQATIDRTLRVEIRDDKRPGEPVVGVYLRGHKFGDAGLKAFIGEHQGTLAEFETLVFSHTSITDAGLEDLKDCVSIRSLGLAGTGVTDAGLAQLAALTKLDLKQA